MISIICDVASVWEESTLLLYDNELLLKVTTEEKDSKYGLVSSNRCC